MKIIKSIKKWLFRVRYNTDEFRKFKAYITNFYDGYDTQWTWNNYRITKCRLYKYPKSIVVEIHSLAPGMIIGLKGECIDRLKAFLSGRYGKPVNIDLHETNPFK